MMLAAISVLCVLGVIWAVILSYSSEKFKVERNHQIDLVLKLLPGINCGACGFAGCEAYAENIVVSGVSAGLCKPGGKKVSDSIALSLGRSMQELVKHLSLVYCEGGHRNAADKFSYTGLEKCSAAIKFFNGQKECPFGCLGFGDCELSCPFGAIRMKYDGLPEIDDGKCTGCGLCVAACPKKIVKLYPASALVHIGCSSVDKGAIVKKYCKTGCIGCGICVKVCPKTAIEMKNNLAAIDYGKCDNCGACIPKCPVKVITKRERSVSIV